MHKRRELQAILKLYKEQPAVLDHLYRKAIRDQNYGVPFRTLPWKRVTGRRTYVGGYVSLFLLESANPKVDHDNIRSSTIVGSNVLLGDDHVGLTQNYAQVTTVIIDGSG